MGLARIGIKDKFGNIQMLEELRKRLNEIPNISENQFKMNNNIKLKKDAFLITDFVIEVDDSVIDDVKKAIDDSGFEIRGNPLFGDEKVKEDIQNMVESHRESLAKDQIELKYAIWFRLEDPCNVHLLEVAEGVEDSEDGVINGIALAAGNEVRKAKYIVVYLASLEGLKKAIEVSPNSQIAVSVKGDNGQLVYSYNSNTLEMLNNELKSVES